MTSGNVNNFVSDLVLMAKAMEELPKVQEQYLQANARWQEGQDIIQKREEAILQLKQEIEALQADKRKLEAERDDAEYRFLEAQDRTASALTFIKSTFGSAGSLIQALEPPAPTPVAMPPAEQEVKHEAVWTAEPTPTEASQSQGQSEPGPTTATANTGSSVDAPTPSVENTSDANTTNSTSSNPVEVPKSDANPPQGTAPAELTDNGSVATSSGADSTTNASAPTTSSSSDRYAGKFYHDHPTYVTREAWIAGGGSDYGYDWRPAAPKPLTY